MKATSAFYSGWTDLMLNKKMWALLYLLNLLFALLASIPLSGFLAKTVGQSLTLEDSLSEYDYTFISDFLRTHGEGLSVVMDQSAGLLFLYFFFSVFLTGGILNVFKTEDTFFRFSTFSRGSSAYFWRLLRLTFYFLLIHAGVFSLFAFIFAWHTNFLSPLELESEMEVLNAFQILAPIYLLVAVPIFMVQDYAKVHLVHTEPTWLNKTILEAFRIVGNNFGSCMFLYLINLFIFLAISGLYWWASSLFHPETMPVILLLFLLGQVFLIARIGTKLLNLGSANQLYKQITIPEEAQLRDEG